ncbi:MAG TPA: HD domain-containing protein [Ktedonobacteraceae bacterium]|nr:HD domain-containing protein [Ktedonobacteraceae bacterium]
MVSKQILEQIKKYALAIDWNIAFGGKSKGNEHLFRVVKIARFLASKEGAIPEICEAGAWLHDIGLIAGNDNEPLKIKAIAEGFLSQLQLDKESQRSIAQCVETHEGGTEAATLEAKIVHDADALDKLGLLGVIRHTWKMINLIHPDALPEEIFITLQNHLYERRHRLYTTTAKRLALVHSASMDRFFQDRTKALALIEKISKLAEKGLISDEIAKRLLMEDDHPGLAEQLCCSDETLEWCNAQGAEIERGLELVS